MWLLVCGLLAAAAPPSSTLSGPTGTLSWTITPSEDGLRIVGRSPKWEVTHQARADLTPVRTVRRDPDGREVTIEYTASGAVVTLPDHTVKHDITGLWDGETLDVRLGQRVIDKQPDATFSAIDTASGKVYGFASRSVGEETCGSRACTHVRVQLSGLLKPFGPTFDYWFGGDGRLLRFEGPAGQFAAP